MVKTIHLVFIKSTKRVFNMKKKLIFLVTIALATLSLGTSASEEKQQPRSLLEILQPAAGDYEFCRLQYENCRNGVGAFQGLKETWKCQAAFDRCRSSGIFVLP